MHIKDALELAEQKQPTSTKHLTPVQLINLHRALATLANEVRTHVAYRTQIETQL